MAHVEFRLLDCAVKIPSAAQELNHAAVSMRSECIRVRRDRKSTRLNSSHDQISYAVFCLKKKNQCVALTLFPREASQTAASGRAKPSSPLHLLLGITCRLMNTTHTVRIRAPRLHQSTTRR